MRFRIRSKPPLAPRDFYRCSWHQVKAAKPGDQGEIEVFVRCIVRNIDENSVASRTSLSASCWPHAKSGRKTQSWGGRSGRGLPTYLTDENLLAAAFGRGIDTKRPLG
jgi:hypothetical protein